MTKSPKKEVNYPSAFSLSIGQARVGGAIVAVIVSLFSSSCAGTSRDPYAGRHYAQAEMDAHNAQVRKLQEEANRTVQIVSDPPGANIEVNGEYLGTSPCTAQLPLIYTYGEFKLSEDVLISALPNVAGHFVQRKFFARSSKPPKKVFFQMNLGPVTPEVDVNVR